MDRATLHVMDVEDWATLVERVALEKVSRVEAENAAVLASSREDAEGFVRKITQLEHLRQMPERCLRGSVRNNLRSSPFYRSEALSCGMPLSAHHG
jgi:ribosomal protein S2